ncbi:unnamed protein product, partial [Mycena citricolor]
PLTTPVMSNVSSAQADFDFWEFVSCSRCQLPFVSDAGATIPFWLTECGHVLCNTHLQPDQSCAQCGMAGIQLVPLQREMEAPMSEWFRSVPHALDAAAYAAKFQQDTMAFQIRFYKSKQQHQRAVIDRLKRETAELKQVNAVLSQENTKFRQHLGFQDEFESSDAPNINNKRPMATSNHQRPRTSSSRSVATPLGPNRLTLPPGQQPPSLAVNASARSNLEHPSHRPGTTQFAEQYAYTSPGQYDSQNPSYAQLAPRRSKQTQDQDRRQTYPREPLPSGKFKPAQKAPLLSHANSNSRGQAQVLQRQSQPQTMAPPPTPGEPGQRNKMLPPMDRFAAPASDQQRFVPSTSSGLPQRQSRHSLRDISTATPYRTGNIPAGSGQRVPFVPHAVGGFG